MTIKDLYKKISNPARINTDSRKLKKGDIFWALKGEHFNGNHFVDKALNAGASLVVCDSDEHTKKESVIVVKNSLECLQMLANYHRKNLNIPILAVTGTNGKTTTKELLFHTLSRQFTTKATQGNFNNHIGVPLTLLSFDFSTEFGIVEMGANHQGEIAELCKIAEPDFGIITNIGKAHLEGFGSFEGVIRAKTELYSHLKNKLVFVNTDNALLVEKAEGIRSIGYGTDSKADVQGKLIENHPYLTISTEAPDNFTVRSQLSGIYNFENIMAAIAVGLHFDLEPSEIAAAIKQYRPNNNRSEVIDCGNSEIILDAYNANPTAVKAATDNLFLTKRPNIMLILGDMFELGDYAAEEHETILQAILLHAKANPDKKITLLTAGPNYYKAGKKILTPELSKFLNLYAYENTESLKNHIEEQGITYKVQVLIKGSRGMAMEKLLESVKKIIQ